MSDTTAPPGVVAGDRDRPAADGGAPTEVLLYDYAAPLTGVLIGLTILVVAAVTGLHDWDDGLAVGIGGATGAGAVFLMAGPGARAARMAEGLVDPREVRVQNPTRALVLSVVVYVAFATLVAVWRHDLLAYGLIVLVVGLTSLFDVRRVRRWEREHEARLAWCRRRRRNMLLHPFRSQRAVGIRNAPGDHGPESPRSAVPARPRPSGRRAGAGR